MREVISYVAFDDNEFGNREECLAYEEGAINKMKEVRDKYSFYDKDMNLFVAPDDSARIDDWLDWVGRAANECEFIDRKDNLSDDADDFIYHEFGYCINNSDFPEENYIGLFRYDMGRCRWVKVDE